MNAIPRIATVTSPSQVYAAGAARGDWQNDPAQHPALAELDRIHAALVGDDRGRHGWLDRLTTLWQRPRPVKGLYYWGAVGRGKTFLIDLFYDALPIRRKRRAHYHHFMREVNDQLRAQAGQPDPLAKIARQWRDSLRVLVLDEFHVTDIGDAMLLGRLLERLFAEGVTLVTTSNAAPSSLYANGLQRERFLPAIALLERHCNVLRSDGRQDYRLRALTRSPVYRTPLDADADTWLQRRWREISDRPEHPNPIAIDARHIPTRARSDDCIWFDFAILCGTARAASDYVEIADAFDTVLLGGIPPLGADNEDAARRFVNLIDALYDHDVNLVCTAAAAPPALYTGHRLQGAFERTASRLIEMQSADYLAKPRRRATPAGS